MDGVLNTHIHPTHFLRAWICWCAWVALSLYLCSLLLVRMHPYTCMTYTMLRPLASYTHTPVPVADVHTYILVLLPRLLFFVYVYHTYLIHIHSMCTCVPYSTRSVPHHTVPQYWYSATPLTHLHVRSQVHIYSLLLLVLSITCHCACHHLILSILDTPLVLVTWHMPLHAL